MGRMKWNPTTGKFEQQYTIPRPPPKKEPVKVAPKPPKKRTVPRGTMGPLAPGTEYEKEKEYTPGQVEVRAKVQDIRTFLAYNYARRRISGTQTYHVPQLGGKDVSQAELDKYRQDTGQPDYEPSYRIIPGHQVQEEMHTEYIDYKRGQLGFQKFFKEGKKEWHPETKVKETTTGYDIIFPYPGAEKYGYYKEYLDKDIWAKIGTRLTYDNILGIPAFIERDLLGHKQKATDIEVQTMHSIDKDFFGTVISSPVAMAPWYFVAGAGIKVGLGYTAGKLALRPVASAIATKVIPTAVGSVALTYAGLDIKTTFERGDIGRGFGKLTSLGIVIGSMGAGYRAGGKLTFRGSTPKQLGYAKAFKPTKIDFNKIPGVKQIQYFKGYHADIKIARGMTFGKGPSSYGKLPGYAGRKPFGADTTISTIEQMTGTLRQSGFRGGDPLKAGAWKQYFSYNAQPKMATKFLSAMKYTEGPIGKYSIAPVYNIKWGLPQLATGEMPSSFRIIPRSAQIPIKISGLKLGKGFRLRPQKIDKIITNIIPKTTKTITTGKGLQSVASTQLRSLKISYKTPISKYMLDFLEPPYQTYVYPTGKRIGILSSITGSKIVSPYTLSASGLTSGLYTDTIKDIKIRKRLGFKPVLKIDQSSFLDTSFRQVRGLSSGVSTKTALASLSKSMTAQATKSVSLLKMKTGLVSKQATKLTQVLAPFTISKSYYKSIITPPVGLPYLPIGLSGRGIGSWLNGGKPLKYMFREFDIGKLFGYTPKRKPVKKRKLKRKRKR